ncbi:MAG: endonuclease domain-containing protein [SAR202 cluster bacterium]|nr:endonuclease domain-containing protein [SAR202 cluster bacterium]
MGKPRSTPRPPSLTLPLKGGEDLKGPTPQPDGVGVQPLSKQAKERLRLNRGQIDDNLSAYKPVTGGLLPSPLEGEGQDRGSKLPSKASKGYDRLTGGKAKHLRRNLTDAERALWRRLRFKAVEGYKFRRQQPIGAYICDFVCLEKRLVIELDGGQHSWSVRHDTERDAWLNALGYKVLRFWNADVLKNPDGVLEIIYGALREPPSSVLPLKGGEGETSRRRRQPLKGSSITEASGNRQVRDD